MVGIIQDELGHAHIAYRMLRDLGVDTDKLIYERPVYPKNLYLEREPYKHADFRREVLEPQIELLVQRGIWRRSGRS